MYIPRPKRAAIYSEKSSVASRESRKKPSSTGEDAIAAVAKSTPRFDFQASVQYSTRVVQSQPLEGLLCIVPLMEYASVSTPQDVILQSLSIAVVSRTPARAAPSLMEQYR